MRTCCELTHKAGLSLYNREHLDSNSMFVFCFSFFHSTQRNDLGYISTNVDDEITVAKLCANEIFKTTHLYTIAQCNLFKHGYFNIFLSLLCNCFSGGSLDLLCEWMGMM